ncbi:hypothetical protein B4O97_03610 [Marispirochaeta aestuarii]|uniref:DUF1064 domain-containing protein n=1 Tax=Marispirochaeta aestuarii TaxID=1963862 RepID=A0A1Y1S1B6_9SPIO|nr:DUF1064 domain-containing protein [Marispirochaeta aestuarii]ORC37289.1 hypothetical protein B4O97_03610 [Marispirochaeta aestuarii]
MAGLGRQGEKLKNKYRNRKTTIDGITFDSKKEAARYAELKMLERAGEIQGLKLQPRYEISKTVKWNGKTLRARFYVADFEYWQNGVRTVEDVKGMRTKEYTLKRHRFLELYGDQVRFIET